MGWGGPESLKGNLGSSDGYPVSAVSWGPNRLDVFGVDADTSELQHWWWPAEKGGWHGPESLGGNLKIPASGYAANAISWGPNRLDVFGQDKDSGRIHHWWWPAPHGAWGGPEPLPGDLISWPVAVSMKAGRLDVFGVGDNTRHLEHWWWPADKGRWGGPESLGSELVFSPSAVTNGPSPLEVFGIAELGDFQHWWWHGGWHGPAYIPDATGLPPDMFSSPFSVAWAPPAPAPSKGTEEALRPEDLHLDAFLIDHKTRQLFHWWFNHGAWEGADAIGGVLAPASSPCAVSWGPGRLDVFAVDGDTAVLQHFWWPMAGGGWHGPESLGGALTGSPSAVSWASGRIDVFGKGVDSGELQHWWWE